ncbi:MAG: Mfa1 fimbrilin C-terminal domain-containing protein [Prevotella sp.]|nr:Mfa1 fimbrilin C-terminal domain-containing protein [Prevotella sp.]MBR1450008.1 Mfa1 fimbrilin C-terminal domain-containing protein [Prevotella sp.]
MKKLFLFGALFAVGLSFTACSSDNDDVQDSSLDSKFDAQGNAYVNIAINLPTTAGTTRANGEFDHGTAAEYEVKDAVLVLFKGTEETTAKFNGAYTLPTEKVNQPVSNNQISDRLLYAQQINKGENAITGSDHIYAFVAINTNGKFTVTANRGLTVTTKSGDQVLSTSTTTTFNEFKDYVMNEIGDPTTNGLLMTNPPMSTAGGGSSAPSSPQIKCMPELTADHIYNSIEEAYAGSKFVEVYVERAAAKIDLSVPSGTSTGLTTDDAVKYDPSGIKWDVQNYNTSFYLTRKVSTTYLGYYSGVRSTPFYRFVEETAVDPSMTTKNYRIPWAEDANYTSTAPENVPSTDVIGKQVGLSKSISDVVYLAENTIDEASLLQQYTTRIVLAVPFNGGTSFYTSSLGGADEIFSVPDMENKVKEYITSKYGATATDVTFTNAVDGSAKVNTITLSGGEDASTIKTEINANVMFSYFLNGMAYYKVLIKHFGDIETPLKPAAEIAGTTYDDIYSTTNRAQNYLGRYSIVRNNWYRITLDGIKHIGKPSVPDIPTDTPDDEIDAYLKVRINILSWALRNQHVTL